MNIAGIFFRLALPVSAPRALNPQPGWTRRGYREYDPSPARSARCSRTFHGLGRAVHLVYELGMTNFSSAEIVGRKGRSDRAKAPHCKHSTPPLLPDAFSPPVSAIPWERLPGARRRCLFLNVTLAPGAKVPADLTHRVSLRVSAAPPGHQEFSETGGTTTVDRQPVASIGPPLRGDALHLSGLLLRCHTPYPRSPPRQRPRMGCTTLRGGLGANRCRRTNLCRPARKARKLRHLWSARFSGR